MFEITNEDIQLVIEKHVLTRNPLTFKSIPVKEKRKFIMISMIVHAFQPGQNYSEKEVNAILKPMVDDYVLIRRYLIDYKFLSRTNDGKSYWLSTDLKDHERFMLGSNHEN
jgi:hypothetical protein